MNVLPPALHNGCANQEFDGWPHCFDPYSLYFYYSVIDVTYKIRSVMALISHYFTLPIRQLHTAVTMMFGVTNAV